VVVDFLKVSESSCYCEGGGQAVTIEATAAVTVEVDFLDSGWIAAATEGSGDTSVAVEIPTVTVQGRISRKSAS